MSILAGMGGMGGKGATGLSWIADLAVGFADGDGLSNEAAVPIGSETIKLTYDRIQPTEFRRHSWHPAYLAQAVLAEFSALPINPQRTAIDRSSAIAEIPAWLSADPDDWDRAGTNLDGELKILMAFADSHRRLRQTEIMAQAEDATAFWANLLMASPVTRPATWTLIEIGQAVGMMVAMHFKRKYSRPRPVEVYPALMPMLLTPPHASYPNAHALQSLLMSGLLKKAVPQGLHLPLDALALRVGQNREIAGVHYPSDRTASIKMANILLPLFNDINTKDTVFYEVMERAKSEWPSPPTKAPSV